MLEVVDDGPQAVDIDVRIVDAVLQGHDHRFRRRLAGDFAEWRQGRVDDVDTGFDGLHIGHFAEAARAVRVQFNRHGQVLLEHADQVVCVIRRQQAGHILDADGVDAHVLQFLGDLGERFHRMDRADGIDQGALDVDGFRVFRRLDGRFQVARVVEGVEDADDVDTVIDGAVDEFVDDVIGIMAVA